MMASQMMIDESRFCSKSEVNGLSRESSSKGVACTHEDDTVASQAISNQGIVSKQFILINQADIVL